MKIITIEGENVIIDSAQFDQLMEQVSTLRILETRLAEVEDLLKTARTEITLRAGDVKYCEEQLAASQLRGKGFLEALREYSKAHNPSGVATVTTEYADRALSTPVSFDAIFDLILQERIRAVSSYKALQQEFIIKDLLKAERAKERERCKAACLAEYEGMNSLWDVYKCAAKSCAVAIEDLGEE